MPARNSVAVWFEIPAADFDRAVTFYESLFGTTLKREDMGPSKLAVFPYTEGEGVSGCVFFGPHVKPSPEGAIVYLNCDGKLDAMIGKVGALGGRTAGPVVNLPEGMGRFVHIVDSEGNRVGLHEAA